MLHINYNSVSKRIDEHKNYEDGLEEAGDGPVTPAGGITRVPGIRGTPKERSQSAYDIPAPNPVARATGQPRPTPIPLPVRIFSRTIEQAEVGGGLQVAVRLGICSCCGIKREWMHTFEQDHARDDTSAETEPTVHEPVVRSDFKKDNLHHLSC
jgi:hypothetical protein